MGCGDSKSLSYFVYYCSLDPIKERKNAFKVNKISEEKITKIEGTKFLYQCGKNKDAKITEFLNRPKFQTNTVFYCYLGEEPIIKSFSQMSNFAPSNSPDLSKIVLLSTDKADIPNQIIEKRTEDIEFKELIDREFNFNAIRNLLEAARNPNLTKDSLSLKDDNDEEAEEKEDEIIISENVTRRTYTYVISKFRNNKKSDYIQINEETSPNEEEPSSDNSKIKTIKIYSSKFDDLNIFYQILNFLHDKKIKKFIFFDNNISQDFEGWSEISNLFKANYSLRFIDLHSSNMYDYDLNDIMRSLIDKRIRYLNLSENFITLNGVNVICDFLRHNRTIQKLNLSRNAQVQFKSEGVKNVVEALMSSESIDALDFSYMNLTGCGESIGNFITKNKSIQSIILRSVQLNAVDFKNIFVPLKTNNILKEIDISLNDMGGDKSLQYIADTIKENKVLSILKMDQINITNDNYQIIFNAIEQNKTINHYSVSFNSKIKPKIMLSFFIKQKQVKYLEYEPFDKDNPEDKKKELTLEEKKLFEKFKTERPDMELIYK
jgi:hypothetical protein